MPVSRHCVPGCWFFAALGAITLCPGVVLGDVDGEHVQAGSFAALLEQSRSDSRSLVEPDAKIDEAGPVIAPLGSEGSWRWSVYGGGAYDPEHESARYNVHWAAEHFLVEDFSVNVELGGLVFTDSTADGDTAFGGNFSILFRYYLPHPAEQSWRLYLDAGAGLLLVTDEVPPGGKTFNFTPQVGAGASFDLGHDGARWMIGVRWHHISNARTAGQLNNPGSDAVMGYVGVSFPWGS